MGEVQNQPPSDAAKVLLGAIVIVVISLLVYGCTHQGDDTTSSAPTTHSAAEIEASVVDTCEDAVRKALKDPDSAKFGDDWKAWQITSGGHPPAGMSYSPDAGDVYYNAGGQVNAKNSYGGYAGDEPYYCDVVVTSAGDVHARARAMADLLNPPG